MCSADLEDGATESAATFMVDGVITKAHLTKSGIVLRPLGVRRCWPLSLRVPSFISFSEILCVTTSQRVPAWARLCRCCITPKVGSFAGVPEHACLYSQQRPGHACWCKALRHAAAVHTAGDTQPAAAHLPSAAPAPLPLDAGHPASARTCAATVALHPCTLMLRVHCLYSLAPACACNVLKLWRQACMHPCMPAMFQAA